MSLKRLLGIISVVIIVVFSMMLTTSYAWYAFDSASTAFETYSNNDDIIINYHHGEYINTSVAIPISETDALRYADKNDFSIEVKNNVIENEIAVTISLVEISIDPKLNINNFIVELWYQDTRYSQFTGSNIGLNGETTKNLTSTPIVLNNDLINNFELRVYLLDDGTNQNTLMGLSFSAKIQINAVSRLRTNIEDYRFSDIYVSNIIVDGEESDSIPTDGYYSMTYRCNKGSSLSWEPLSKTITYGTGSYVNDVCDLTFSSATNYPLLSDMPQGSYVKYVGDNGCVGKSCEGRNANYSSDTSMGYCNSANYKFYVNGWRIGYIENGSAYLISAGATDCMSTSADGKASSSNGSADDYVSAENIAVHINNMNSIALRYCNKVYAYGEKCNSNTTWAMNANDFAKITENVLSGGSCYQASSSKSCGWTNDLIDTGGYYWYGNPYSDGSSYTLYWDPYERGVYRRRSSDAAVGVRPVLRLKSSVVVIGGMGTYDEPYIIAPNG